MYASTYYIIQAENSKENWRTCIKIISIVLIIIGGVSIFFDILSIFTSILTFDEHEVHYNYDDAFTTAEFFGFSGIIIQFLEIAQNWLIIYQGWIGYQAIKTDTQLSIKKLMKYTIYLVVAHMILFTIKLMVGGIAIASYEDE